jgi:hypothetical protein
VAVCGTAGPGVTHLFSGLMAKQVLSGDMDTVIETIERNVHLVWADGS